MQTIMQIIKNKAQYVSALEQANVLVAMDPPLGSLEADRLELLALLIEDFEKTRYSIDAPDPVSAIEFHLNERGLRKTDLIPILGSRSRVSEVLGRKRPLSLSMIRSLSEKLGIPSDILIQPINPKGPATELDWTKFPFKEMQRRGWIPATNKPQECVRAVKHFLDSVCQRESSVALYRRHIRGVGVSQFDEREHYATYAWTARVLSKAENFHGPQFKINSLSEDFLSALVSLSTFHNGPKLAIERLSGIGVAVIIEPKLANSLMDGAAMLTDDYRPVIGLTLRYDRVDHFWFTLMHELAHVWRHLNSTKEFFADRLDVDDSNSLEKEANRIARDALIPRSKWNRSAARVRPSTETILRFAKEIDVHPAIVAGRVRFDTGQFTKYGNLLGQGTVKLQFKSEA